VLAQEGGSIDIEVSFGISEPVAAIFAEIDRQGGANFIPDGRPEQPAMPMQQRAAFEE